MKFKKAVSAFSALAIAISVFASVGVTANAATIEDGYKIGEVLYGTTVVTDEVVTAVNNQTEFTGDANETADSAPTDGNNNTASFAMGGSALNTSANWTKDFTTPVSSGKVYFSCDYTVSANNANTIRILGGNDEVIYTCMDGTNSANGTYTVATINGEAVSQYVRLPRNAMYRINLVMDLDANTITYSGIASSKNGSVTNFGPTTITGFTTESIKGLSVSKTNYGSLIDNVVLYSVESSVQQYDYTINYKLDGAETPVKVSTASVAANTVVTAESVFWVDEQKYFITDETAPTLTVTADGTNTLDVTVRKANEYTCKVVADVNGTTKDLSSATIFEGETFNYVFPMYVQDGTTVYEVAANESSPYYGGSIANVTKDETITKTYNLATYENVVLYDELDGATGQSADVRASNCSSYDNASYTSSVELEPGYYTVKVRCAHVGRAATMTIGDDVIIDSTIDCPLKSWTTVTKTVYVDEKAPLVWDNSGTKNPIDTILVMEAEAPTITTASATADGETALPAEPTAETKLLNTADGAESGKTYADAAPTGTTVKTIYAKIENPITSAPVIKIGGVEMASKWTPVAGTNIYFAQFIGGEGEFATGGAYENVQIVCGDVVKSVAWN